MTDKAKCGFVWYEHMADDLDKAVSFYSAVVRWEIRDSGMPGMRYLLFGRSGKDVGGLSSWTSMGMKKPAKWIGHIYSPDVDAETAAVMADGGHQHRPPQDIPNVGRFSVVVDPQGAEYMLFQPNHREDAPSRLAPPDLGSVGWHELTTSDWQKAWDFYSTHYGWTKDVLVDMGPMGHYQTFSLDNKFGGGMMNTPPALQAASISPEWGFYFVVDSIHAAADRVTANGGMVVHGPAQVAGGSWILNAVDSQGGRFALTAAT